MLDALLYLGQNGVISEISKYAQDYLQTGESTAHTILNTILNRNYIWSIEGKT